VRASAFITPSSFEIHPGGHHRRAGTRSGNLDETHARCRDSLDESQKHKFGMLGRMLMPERSRLAMEMMRHHMGEGDRDGSE